MSKQKLVQRLLDNFDKAGKGASQRIGAEIQRNRKGWGLFIIQDTEGKPLRNVEIHLSQKSHEFRFGCNLFKLKDFKSDDKNKAYETYFKRIFNQGVVPLFWDTTEPEPGELRFTAESRHIPRRPPTDVCLDWCEANGIEPKGHWLLCDNFVPKWLQKNSREVMKLLERRIEILAERYGTRIPAWDVINEPFAIPRRSIENPSAILPDDYVLRTFKLAERHLPESARLLFNDGDEYFRDSFFHYGNSPDYMMLQHLLHENAKVDGFGMQFHRYGRRIEDWFGGPERAAKEETGPWWIDTRTPEYFNPFRLQEVMDLYGKLRPINISEISLSTLQDIPRPDAEALQAELLKRLYSLWFSHERMEGITWWNLCDKTAYVAPSGAADENEFDACLIDGDFQEKPSYKALDHLVNKEWHTEATIHSDEHGMAEWCGFHGEYDAILTQGGKRCQEKVKLSKFSPNEYRLTIQA